MERNSSVARRDEVLFEALMTEQFHDVWSFVRRRTANTADADDVTSQVFATAWRRRDHMPVGDDRRLWLFGVARLSLKNHHRSARRQSNLHLRLIDTAAPATVQADDIEVNLGDALAELSREDRDILMMRAWDGFAVNEIANLLGCTPNAASLRLHKARRRLQLALDEKDRPRDGHVPVEPTAQERR